MRKTFMKRLATIAIAACAALSLSSCQTEKNTSKRDTVKIYCWSEHVLYNGYASYVQSQVPEADVVFMVGQNNIDYYKFMNQHGNLPDIITLRRMSMIDAKLLRDQLLDLSETEAAAGFNNIYLENYRFDDGTINWLPACGEVDGYIANLDLFEKYDVPIPTDRESFDAACEAFKKVGITPYSCDFTYDYTCLETLQGLSIQEMMTVDGLSWRTAYESGVTDTLDTKIWPAAFDKLAEYLELWEIPEEGAKVNYYGMVDPFFAGEAAMMRGTGNDIIQFKNDGMNVMMLPYFGDTENDNWLLTYPSFNVAVNKDVSNDKKHEELCLKVLEVMFSDEAQNILAGSHNMIPYNTGVTLTLDDSMANLKQYIDNNHLYLRLASTEIFTASRKSVRGMITGEFTAREAYDEFNRIISTDEVPEEPIVAHFDKGYSFAFDSKKGNESASAMTNTLRNYYGTDILIANGLSYSGVIYATDYTEKQLGYMITDTTILPYQKEITGAQLKMLLKNVLEKNYAGLEMINNYSLPILSGCEMKVVHDAEGYHLDSLTIDGKPIDETQTFNICYLINLYAGDELVNELWADEGGRDSWNVGDRVRVNWIECILGSEEKEPIPLAEPTSYITLIEK